MAETMTRPALWVHTVMLEMPTAQVRFVSPSAIHCRKCYVLGRGAEHSTADHARTFLYKPKMTTRTITISGA
jgi:hypothetical protein